MSESEYIAFLQWALPHLSLRWAGFRKVRGQVIKRIKKRVDERGCGSPEGYKAYLNEHPDEWDVLDEMCRITISRFYRDRGVFESIERIVLPALAEIAIVSARSGLHVLSAGSASGEEPYSISIAWRMHGGRSHPELKLSVVATDTNPYLIEHARRGEYEKPALKDLPASWISEVFLENDGIYTIESRFRAGVEFMQLDIRKTVPGGPFDLILCRNLVLTYYDHSLRDRVVGQLVEKLRPGGAFVVGIHERMDGRLAGLTPWDELRCVYRKI